MSLAQMKFVRLLTSTVIRRRPIPNSLFAPTAFHPGTIRLFSSKVIDGDDLDDYESLENPLKGRISKKKKLMYKRSQEELEKEKARKSGGGGGLTGKEKKTSETDGVENEEETLLSSLPQIAEPDEYLNSKEIDKRMIGLVIERHLNRFLVQRLLPRNSTESAVSNFPSQAALENLPKAKRVAVEYQRNLDIDHQYDDNDHDKKVAYNLNNFFLCYASSKMAFESHINLVPGDYVSYYTMKETPSAIKEAIDNTTHHLPQKQNETSSVIATGKKQKRIPPYPSLPMNQYRPAWITDTLPRSNLFQRPSATSESRKKVVFKSIAANVTQLFILVATRPYVPLPTIDRYLITAKLFNIPKVHLIVNKYDLGEESRELYHELLFYEKILGTKILRTSIESEDGIDDIKNLLIGQTSIFVGQSGVGKSSLINLLFPHIAIKTNPLGGTSEQFGAHTTSNARLYHFYGSSPDDQTQATIPTVDDGQSGEQVTTPTLQHGVVIDSPGIREMGTWHLSLADIEFGFDEIYEFSKSCKYRNCNHLEYNGEENCAVVEAVNAGNIHEARYRSFLQLIKQIGYANDRR